MPPRPTPRPAAARALGHGLAVFVVAIASKALVLALAAADGSAVLTPSLFLPFVLVHEDVGLAAIAAAASWIATALTVRVNSRAGALVARSLAPIVYVGFVAYTALNIPVARFFSTPLTHGLLRATGGALSDSLAREATPANLLALAILIALATRAPRLGATLGARLAPPRRFAIACAAAGVVAALGARGRAEVESAGLHRNAVVAIVRTTLADRAAADRHPAAAPAFTAQGPAIDLGALRGVARGRNVLWIVLESTAARYLAPYGAPDDPTPRLTRFAREALVFEAAYAAYPESIKGLHAQLCADSPAPHTAIERYAADRLACASVVARFRAAGYRTGLFHSGRFGYMGMEHVVAGKGFDQLVDAATATREAGADVAVTSFGVDEAWTVDRVLAFVDAHGDAAAAQPFFAMYLPIAGHHPYHSPGVAPAPFPTDGGFGDYRNDLYKGDRAIGVLLDGLAARGRLDDTVVLVVGDHGEAFAQHPGNQAHTLQIYDENVRVPLYLRVPGGGAGRRVPQVASAIDLGPTLLDLAGLPPSAGVAGRSLLAPRPGLARFFVDHGVTMLGLREDRWKVILDRETGRAKLFDLARDPDERTNLAAHEPARVAAYRAHLEAWATHRRGVIMRDDGAASQTAQGPGSRAVGPERLSRAQADPSLP